MQTVRGLIAASLIMFILHPTLYAAVRGDKAAYVGGTVKEIKEGEQGVLTSGLARR